MYAPFPNETLQWLNKHNVLSIVGNTDRKIKKLLKGKNFVTPKKIEKRIMYTWTAEQLSTSSKNHILSLKKTKILTGTGKSIILCHGSPADPDEFLFPHTPKSRFVELASSSPYDIILCGHSHTPFHKTINDIDFINPGSVGRMFDGNPEASCAVLEITQNAVTTHFYRIPWDIQKTIKALKDQQLPPIYQAMFLLGRKLN